MGISVKISERFRGDNIYRKYGGKVVNDVPLTNEGHMELKNALIMTIEGGIALESSCACGVTTQSRHSVIPNVCPVCKTDPSDLVGKALTPLVYLRTPIGVNTLVNTNFWNQMRTCFTRGVITGKGISLLRWVTDPNYIINDKHGVIITDYFTSKGIVRGYNNFIANMDEYLEIMVNEPTTFSTKDTVKDMYELYKQSKDKIFTDYIPFMDKITRVMEKNTTNKRAADGFVDVIDAIIGVASIDSDIHTVEKREAMIARFMEAYTIYWDTYLTNTVQGKYGFIRGTLYRTRGVRISRLVASSITEPHDHTHVQLPWLAMVISLETPITSILLRKGLSLCQIKDFIQHCCYNYNKTMDDVLNKIVVDAMYTLPTTIRRYPSLTRGSELLLNGFDYKRNPDDFTVSISPLAIASLNADYDGDALHCSIYLDKVCNEILEVLQYHYTCLDNVSIRKVKNIGLTVPLESNLFSWLEDSDTLKSSPEKDAEMLKMFG